MSKGKPLPPVLQLLGPEDSGKSILARLFIESFRSDADILVIDPSPNQTLAGHYGLEAPLPTLTEVLTALRHRHPSPEEQDWHFQELLIPLPLKQDGDRDVLFIGGVPDYGLFQAEASILAYALPRLLQQADCIIHDGPIGPLKPFLERFEVLDLVVIRPDDESFCQALPETSASVILSQAQVSDSPPPTAQERIATGTWRLMGKVPALPESFNPNLDALPASFQDCFARLDLPLSLVAH